MPIISMLNKIPKKYIKRSETCYSDNTNGCQFIEIFLEYFIFLYFLALGSSIYSSSFGY